ncbi:MAG: G1 family endopeptidase [Thermaerobacter sp.]|nr:G1 family endopeptidase [Thermaerobacter sp.]
MAILLAAGVPVAPVASGAGALGGRVHPLRTPGGRVAHNLRQAMETSNWSGYAVAYWETGDHYAAATAQWTVPAVTAPPGFSTGYSSSWLGIGGFCLDANCTSVDSTLIQLGTEQNASSTGATQYFAWFETLPKPSKVIRALAIHPGDLIQASLADGPTFHGGKTKAGGGSSAKQTWTLTMRDVTTGTSWSTTLRYASSLASAEWVEEAPWSGGVLPLADFGTATFDPGTVNGVNPLLTTQEGIVMNDPNGQTANPSAPDSDTDGFNVCWGNGTSLTSCSAPNS